MSEDLKFNNDGSIDLTVEDKPVRFVKESDLLAVKGAREKLEQGWETEKATFNTQLAEANRLREESNSQLLQVQAAKEQLAEQYKDYDTHKTRVGELETNLVSHREKLASHEKELSERMHQSLIGAGATEESLKEKTLDQLRSLEEAAKVFGKSVKPANYDGNKGLGAGTPLIGKPMELARQAYESK